MNLATVSDNQVQTPPRELSQRIAVLQQVLPFALMIVVMLYEVTRHVIFSDVGHPLLFGFEMLMFGIAGPAVVWLTLNWIRAQVRARERAEGEADMRTRLMLEMHHRIKNNLQTVADLLSLELARPDRPQARAAQESLRDSVARIKSIAAAHELLSTDQIGLTDITELARRVSESARVSNVRPSQTITIDVSGPPILLPSKSATAFALVINELVSNAFEHGLAERAQGHINIALEREEGQVKVELQDDGAGLAEGFDLRHQAGLGLNIVRTLVEKDLRGAITMTNNAGTQIEFSLKA